MERAALALLTLGPNLTALSSHEFFADIQPQRQTLSRVRRLLARLEEPRKDSVDGFWWHAATGIRNRNATNREPPPTMSDSMEIDPFSVNLMALWSRFVRICRSTIRIG